MKKLLFLLLGLVALTLVSCKDTSGDYVAKQLTYTQMENAFSDCLSVATDYAVERLCPADELSYALGYGFYDYKSKNYRITLPTSARAIVDSLTAHGQAALIDSMVLLFIEEIDILFVEKLWIYAHFQRIGNGNGIEKRAKGVG